MYWQVYSMVFDLSNILFDNLFVFTHKRTKIKLSRAEYYYEIYYSLQKILEYANDRIKYCMKVYGEDKRFILFQRHPFA